MVFAISAGVELLMIGCVLIRLQPMITAAAQAVCLKGSIGRCPI